ncbi:MAG: DNA mismatch repair endonuclease MutL [Clostridiales bacterium]|nr:DNA mismatch repair endonuclease MutL [Clostridiales bacterium]
MKIEVLENNMINKIAAGEVVERPASVVKELTENSIDAGASQITVEIKDGGISYIRISDNGCGIAKDELKTAFLRHATSKIRNFDDLANVMTLGFRGEALSSISAVAQTEMVTKTANSVTGSKIEIHGGQLISFADTGAATGTTIIIKNLFFNTPARRKFLKKASAEAGLIHEFMQRLALAHPEVAFKFFSGGQNLLSTNGGGDLKAAVLYVYGKDFAKNLIEISEDTGEIKLSGYICSPEISRGNRSFGNFFINGRYVKDKIVREAVEEAYKYRLMGGKFPVYVINMRINPAKVDVNVHPSKLEVRFENEDEIFRAVSNAVKTALEREVLVKEVKWDRKPREKVSLKVEDTVRDDSAFDAAADSARDDAGISATASFARDDAGISATANSARYGAGISAAADTARDDAAIGAAADSAKVAAGYAGIPVASTPSLFDNADFLPRYTPKEQISEIKSGDNAERETAFFAEAMRAAEGKREGNVIPEAEYKHEAAPEQSPTPEQKPEALPKPGEFFTDYKIVGQLFKTYWIVEQNDKMYVIDQHAAHERVLYEQYLAKFENGGVSSQMLLMPEKIKLTPVEAETVKDNLELLTRFGFEIEEFTPGIFLLRALPVIFSKHVKPDFLIEIIDSLAGFGLAQANLRDIKSGAIASISCKAAVKANENLSKEECESLIKQLLKLENPFNCPHGRPTIISMTKYEIEKKFGRK